MLRGKQRRQFIEQVHFELPGDGLGYILAELAAPDSLLDSRGEIRWHGHADLARRASILNLGNYALCPISRSATTYVRDLPIATVAQ